MIFFYNAPTEQGAGSGLLPGENRPVLSLTVRIKTLLLGVKITIVLFLMTCVQVNANDTNAQRLSISIHNGSLEKLFAEIEKKTSYVFFYDAAILKGTKPITLEMREANVEDILEVSLKGQSLEYSIHDRTIFVKKNVKPTASSGPSEKGEPPAVKGVVTSEGGNPLVGASITIRKLKKTGITNENGEFALKDIPNGQYQVEISYVGFETYVTTVTVEDHHALISADLKQLHNALDETVVKGYYSTTNRLNTGDVSKVKAEQIQSQPVTDFVGALEGRVPGLYISQTGGALPGAAFSVSLMGRNSIANGNDPLYIVDGVPFGSNYFNNGYVSGTSLSPFNNLNISDIESIEVLKDADATAIYGSRGANGVILITTKKGKAGKVTFNFNIAGGRNSQARKSNLLNTQQYLSMRHKAFENDSAAPSFGDYDLNGTWDTTRYTDWQKFFYGNTAGFTNVQGSISGGNSNTQYLVSGAYSKQDAILPGNFYDKKGSVHTDINSISANRKFAISATASYVNDYNFMPSTDISQYVLLCPVAPPLYDQFGNLNWSNSTWTNPLAQLKQTIKSISDNLIGNISLSYEVLPGLKVSLRGGGNYLHLSANTITPITYYDPAYATSDLRQSSFATRTTKSWIAEPQLNYSTAFGDSRIDFLAGLTFQENSSNSYTITGYNYTTDALLWDVAAAASYTGINYTQELYHYSAGFARIGYNFRDKYLLNLTARRDGSSRFGPGNQFGNFGAVGVGWIFSKEKIFDDHFKFLSFGKIRASYGTAGNDQIANYKYLSMYGSSSQSYQNVAGLVPTSLANPNFGWELDKKFSAGLELGFFKDRLLASAAYFRNRTANQLVGYSLPTLTGFSSVQANLPAVVQNTGFEFTMNSINVQTQSFKWTTSFNLTVPRNKLVSYPNLAGSSYANTYVVGKSLYVQKLYHYTGLDSKGVYSFSDLNHDGQITSPDDLAANKEITQQYFGGIQNSFSYKGVQLDVFFQIVKQTGLNYVNNFPQAGLFFPTNNQPTFILNDKDVQRFTQQFSGPLFDAWLLYVNSDAKVNDASFWRLKNIQLSYTLPPKVLKRVGLQNVKFYVQSQNLLTITKYKGMDPENQGSIPPAKTIVGGINIGF